MKKLFSVIAAFAIGMTMFAQAISAEENINKYAGKTIAVFASGQEYDYNANQRTWSENGNQGSAMAASTGKWLNTMMKWYGGNVVDQFSPQYRELQSVIDNMDGDGDFSVLQATAKELGVDYIFMDELVWMMYQDQLYIYEFQIKMLDVANNVIDRMSVYSYINAFKDANNMDAASQRLSECHYNAIFETTAKISPRLWGVVSVAKNGKKAEMLPATYGGHYTSDVFYYYKLASQQRVLHGSTYNFFTLTHLAKSTKYAYENGKYTVNLDTKLKMDPAMIVSAGNMINSAIPFMSYPFVPISVISLEKANAKSYDNHNREVTNYALYNAINKNKALKVVANPSSEVNKPRYECRLSNYSEEKNVVTVTLTIKDLVSNITIKEKTIESHTSNIDAVLATVMNDVFATPAALGNIEKKTISYFVPYPIACSEGEKFVLTLADENQTPVVMYTLLTWNGQEYIFEELKTLNGKVARKIGKDPNASYILKRHVDTMKDPKKDNSEFKKVAAVNKVFDMLAK